MNNLTAHGRTTRVYEQTITFIECYTCGLPVAVTRSQERQYDEHGLSVSCALGHHTVRRKSDNQELQEKLQQAQDRVGALETAQRNMDGLLDTERVKRTKLEKRIHNGVCPHCRRSFKNLQRHMSGQHPG